MRWRNKLNPNALWPASGRLPAISDHPAAAIIESARPAYYPSCFCNVGNVDVGH